MSLTWRGGDEAAASLEAAVALVAGSLSYLRAEGGPRPTVATGEPVREDAWVRSGDLLASPIWLAKTMRDTGRQLGTEDPVVAASLFVQNYAYRVFTLAVASVTVAGVLPDSSPATMAVSMRRGRPSSIAYLDARVATLDPAALRHDSGLGEDVVDELLLVVTTHLSALVESVRATTRVGNRLLWGNVAASCAVAFRTLEGVLGPWVRPLGESFLERSPSNMRGLGSYLLVERGARHGWFFERTTCCLYDRLPGAVRCADCSRTPRDERRDAYWRSLGDV